MRDEPELTAVLDSAHLVTTDHLGCTLTPAPPQPPAGADERFLVPSDPARFRVRVCGYGQGVGARLAASAEMGEADAAQLVTRINAAPPGLNPDPPAAMCVDLGPTTADVVLLFVDHDDSVQARLWLTYSPCAHRGMDNSVRQGQVDYEIVKLVMTALHTSYGMSFPSTASPPPNSCPQSRS